MLSLVLGIDITDASVDAISSSYTNLELLDLSGYVLFLLNISYLCLLCACSREECMLRHVFVCLLVFSSSITDTGLGMICDVLPDTLSKLLVALCPNITSSKFLIFGLQYIS